MEEKEEKDGGEGWRRMMMEEEKDEGDGGWRR